MSSEIALLAALPTWISPLWWVLVCDLVVLGTAAWLTLHIWFEAPKLLAIARTTLREALSQPLFYVLLSLGAVAMLVLPYVPYNTFGEDIKMLKDGGLTIVMLLSVVLAIWTASASIAEEIENRVVLTLLSKPLGRRQYIIGKFLGIVAAVTLMFVILGSLFLVSVSFKVVYDARETAAAQPTVQDCLNELRQITPGLPLALMEAIVLTALGVAISTRLPIVPNLVICLVVYLLGHLMPTLVAAAAARFEITYFVAQLLATVLPLLETFNIYTAISTGQTVPLEYLGWAALYCALYSTVALIVGMLLLESRDIA